jgi:MFS family permease
MLNAHYRRIARKTVWTLFAAQSFSSVAFLAVATVNSIAGAKLGGDPSWGGVPTAVYQLGAALAAFGWGYGMDRLGRRGGLTLGLVCGVAGSAVAGGAIVVESFLLFLGGMVLMGMANSAMNLARFAAAEVHPPQERGRAISNVVIGGTAGTLVWPFLSTLAGGWARQAGVNEFVWPYGAGLALLVAAAIAVALLLRPDPRDVGREIAPLISEEPSAQSAGPARSTGQILRQPAVLVAMTAMVMGQTIMVMLMVITSLHMNNHNHNVEAISLVTSSHVFGMYAFSILSGRLADRWGREPVILVGAVTLILACLAAPLSPDVLPIALALFLLGFGWNFCYVGGSSLLADQLSPDERARTQGFNDLLISLVSAAGSFVSGIGFAVIGYGAMGLVGAAAAVIPLGLVLWWQVSRPTVAVAQ